MIVGRQIGEFVRRDAREPPARTPHTAALCEKTVRRQLPANRERALARTAPYWRPDLGLPAFRTERKYICVVKPVIYDILLIWVFCSPSWPRKGEVPSLILSLLLWCFFPGKFYLCLMVSNSFFSFIFISWRLITLQYCSGFCHTLTWISHGVTCIPHLDPPSHLPLHPIPLGLLSAPGLSTCLMHPAWAGDLFHPR